MPFGVLSQNPCPPLQSTHTPLRGGEPTHAFRSSLTKPLAAASPPTTAKHTKPITGSPPMPFGVLSQNHSLLHHHQPLPSAAKHTNPITGRGAHSPVPKDAERHWDVNLILFTSPFMPFGVLSQPLAAASPPNTGSTAKHTNPIIRGAHPCLLEFSHKTTSCCITTNHWLAWSLWWLGGGAGGSDCCGGRNLTDIN